MRIATSTAALAMACALGSHAVAQSSDKEQYYPAEPLKYCLSGRVQIQCTVTPDGTLTGCAIQSETPPDVGFGEATLYLAKIWKLRPFSADGKPTSGGVFRRAVIWKPPPDCVAAK
jgi:protein TonB